LLDFPPRSESFGGDVFFETIWSRRNLGEDAVGGTRFQRHVWIGNSERGKGSALFETGGGEVAIAPETLYAEATSFPLPDLIGLNQDSSANTSLQPTA